MKNNFTRYFLLILLITTSNLFSQITLDNTFGTNGKVITSFGSDDAIMATMAIQADGRIIACGSYYDGTINQIILSRYNTDGSLDVSFGTNGKILTPIGSDNENEHNAVRVLNNGKILVAGTNGTFSTTYDFAIVQYNVDGTLDSGFGSNGVLLSDFNNEINKSWALEIQTDNKIIVGGYISTLSGNGLPDFAIARYDSDGSSDTSFGINGLVSVNLGTLSNNMAVSEDQVESLKIQPDGKILASGWTYIDDSTKGDFGLVRLNSDGSLDNSFGNNGRVITDFGDTEQVNSMQILSDGKIILSGIYYFNDDENEKVAIAKYNSDGTLDTTYGINGKVIADFGNSSPKVFSFSSEIQADGKLLVIGYIINTTVDFFISRYNIDGSLDVTLDSDGFQFIDFGVDEGAFASVFQPDGKLILGGGTANATNFDFTLLRFDMDALSTNDFLANNAVKVYPIPFLNEINLDFNLNQTENITIDLFDINGRKITNLIKNKEYQLGNNYQKIELPETLSKGIFFLNISNGSSTSNIKIVK